MFKKHILLLTKQVLWNPLNNKEIRHLSTFHESVSFFKFVDQLSEDEVQILLAFKK